MSAQTHCIYIILSSSVRSQSIWYYEAGLIQTGISKASSRLFLLIFPVIVFFFFPPLCLCITALRPKEGLFRHYLSGLVFPSTKLRMNESNPSVFDPQPQNVLLFSLWRWRRWKASPSLSFFFLFIQKQNCGSRFFLCEVTPPCGWLQRQIPLISLDHLTWF